MGPSKGLRVQGDIKDLVLAIPYLLHSKIVPPRSVLNEIFGKGIYDAGMSGGCSWKPFEISQEEYNELVEELLTIPEKNFIQMETPDRITTYSKWQGWAISQSRKRNG